MQDHNERKGKLPNNVDLSRSHLNRKTFRCEELEPRLIEELKKRINRNKTVPNRKKVGVKGCQKNTPWCGEILCFGTEKAFRERDAEGKPTEEYDMKKIREHSKLVRKWAKKEFGKNLISIDLHMDEAEPHWHVVVAFESDDGKYNAKALWGGPPEMRERQTRYWEECGKPLGMARGEPGSKRAHTTIKEFQERMDAAKGDAMELMKSIENPPVWGKGKWREETHKKIEGIFTKAAKMELELEQAREDLRLLRKQSREAELEAELEKQKEKAARELSAAKRNAKADDDRLRARIQELHRENGELRDEIEEKEKRLKVFDRLDSAKLRKMADYADRQRQNQPDKRQSYSYGQAEPKPRNEGRDMS